MPSRSLRTSLPRLLGAGAGLLLGLAVVVRLHAAGQPLLAAATLAVLALAVWTYGPGRSVAARYVFPGILAAAVFVILPMVYTMAMSLSNASSLNLLERDEALAVLLSERQLQESTRQAFSLHRESAAVRLRVGDSVSPAIDRTAPPAPLLPLQPLPPEGLGPALPVTEVIELLPMLRGLRLQTPQGTVLQVATLREVAAFVPRYTRGAPRAGAGAAAGLVDVQTGKHYFADDSTGFFAAADGERLQPGYRVGVGLQHYRSLLTETRFREPFVGVLWWTILFSALSVIGAAGLGLLLAVLLNWDDLEGRGIYRVILFLPYAVPGFISILVFKGLFNPNLGEINAALDALFGIRPAWFSDPLLARSMLVIVNVWLGFPYMMLLCSGLIKAIPADLYEASALAGAGPWVNFRRITAPLIVKPLMPLLIAAFAFNFNNFVLISLLTAGRPDQLDSAVPVGTTDILVSYTWRVAFEDSGQQFGLAAAISTLIFAIVAAVTLLQMRLTRIDTGPRGR